MNGENIAGCGDVGLGPGCGGTLPGGGGWTWSTLQNPFSPFVEHKPQTKGFYAIKLSADNLAALAEFYVSHGRCELIIPPKRDHLTIYSPNARMLTFEFGDWIVLDWLDADDGNKAVYRRPTSVEVDTYGLNV